MNGLNKLWPYPQAVETGGSFAVPDSVKLEGEPLPAYLVEDIAPAESRNAHPVTIKLAGDTDKRDGYVLNISDSGTELIGDDSAGIAYGMQTLLQLMDIFKGNGKWSEVRIKDQPAYRKRAFMIDMGRSVFSMEMLKRIVRILAALKMNQLHLHLYDDELCGLKFDGLPFGEENPFAITIAGFAELVEYASEYHVEIVPELEAWGHVGSLVYHRKNLRGGKGMYEGSSFLICEETFDLMKELVRQVAEVMPSKATIHFGLDEAEWFLSPSMSDDFTPTKLVGRYYEILQEVAGELGKDLTMRLWADHSGRAIPQEIQHNVIIEPWQYWRTNYPMIDKAIAKYSGEGKMRWMAGAGQSAAQYRGAYHATQYWCKQAINSSNVEGCNITFWGGNNLAENFISLFAGSYYLWNPFPPTEFADIDDYEDFDRKIFPVMYWWQNRFRDALHGHIKQDQGPFVYNGFYMGGPKYGTAVAPTAPLASTIDGHDFINE